METIITASIGINVGEQDTTEDSIEEAKEQIRSMDIEELIRLMKWYETTD